MKRRSIVHGAGAAVSGLVALLQPVVAGSKEVAVSGSAAMIGFLQAGAGALSRSLDARLRDVVSVKDFGARGDGVGATPASEGIDIMAQPWNTWNGTPFKTNAAWSPYWTSGRFVPPDPTPFVNTDTWDFIGCQLALWAGARSVFFPEGIYLINFSANRNGIGLIRMKGQEGTFHGAGTFETIIKPVHDAAFFASRHVGAADYYKLLYGYRTSGPPSTIHSMSLQGPRDYPASSMNLTLSCGANINGVTHRDLWLSSAARGITGNTASSDCHIKGITAEYLFEAAIHSDASSDFSVDFCNLWASAHVTGQKGIAAGGRVAVTNCKFVDFAGGAIKAASGLMTGCTVRCPSGGAASAVSFGGNAVIVGNDIEGAMDAPLLTVGPDSTITGNRIKVTSPRAAIDCGNGAPGSATNITVQGNTLIKTDTAPAPHNVLITAAQQGAGFTQAATPSLSIQGNTLQGAALAAVGAATVSKNILDGALQATTFNEPVALTGDVTGRAAASGRSALPAYSFTLSVLGAGASSARDLQRLTLVSATSTGAGHLVRGWALYTAGPNGQAMLVSTLGSSATGGTIAFSVNGPHPSVTVVNTAGGTATYEASAIALI